MVQDSEVSEKLSALARQEDMDTDLFVLNLLDDALQARRHKTQNKTL